MNQKRQGSALLLLGLLALTACAKPASSSLSQTGTNTSNDTGTSTSQSASASQSTSTSTSKSTATSNSTSTSESTSASTSTSISSSKEDEYVVALFLDYDGSLLSEQHVIKGAIPDYEGPVPHRNSDTHYNYTWKGWDKPLAALTENTTYTAVYEQDQFAYDAKFVDHDGSIIATILVYEGNSVFQTVQRNIPEPKQTIYTVGDTGVYVFSGYNGDLSAPLTADTTFTAQYTFNSDQVATFYSFPNDVTLEAHTGSIDSTYDLPTPRASKDSKFEGWYTDEACTTAANSSFTMSKNTTIYAKYTAMTKGADFDYQIVGDHVEIISVFSTKELVEVPSTLENKPVTVIKNKAVFHLPNTISLVIAEGITTIEDEAVSNNENLAIVTIPASVTSIGKNNFSLTIGALGFPKTSYFYVDENNLDYVTTDGHLIIDHNTLTIVASATYGLTTYTLPSNIRAIGDYAFRGSALNVVYGSDALTTIGEGAFYTSAISNFTIMGQINLVSVGKLAFFSTRITSFWIGSKTTTVGPGAFAGETPLSTIRIYGSNDTFTWANSCLYKTATGELVAAKQGISTLPAAIKSIAPYTFYGTLGTSLTVQGAITSIGEYAFANTHFVSPSLVFSDTSALTTIGDYAFANNPALSTFNIPAQVTSIGKGVFFGCSALATITVDPTNTAFSSISNIFLVKNATPINQVNLIVAFAPKNMNGNFVLPPLPFLALADELFGHNSASGITQVSVAPLTQLSANVFFDVYGITTIDLSTATFTTVVTNAFAYGHSLTTLTLPSTITSIETNAFLYSLVLTHLNFAGTKAQWAQIHFATGWNAHVGFNTVTCSDGDVAITPSFPD